MKQHKNDILLIGGVLLLAVLVWLMVRPGDTGGYVVVSGAEGELLSKALDQDFTTTLTTEDGGYNTLVIENGAVYVSDANCGDQTCIRAGRISREGEQIVCLPHKLIIEIVGGGNSALDGTTH